MIISYIFGVIVRIIWLPMHSIGYVFGVQTPAFFYNYYSQSAFSKLMKSAEDKEGTAATYEQYLESMRETISKFIRDDMNAIVFHVDVDEMLRWMTENKLTNIHENRSKYALVQKDLAIRNGVRVCKDPIPGITLDDKPKKGKP